MEQKFHENESFIYGLFAPAPIVLYGITAVSHVNAHRQSLGPTEKLLFQFTSFFGCLLICLLQSPGSLKISRRNPCSPFFSFSYSINRHKIL